jgi:large subunit ribosomal protein L9
MKVFLTKNVEKIGLAGEILKVADGFAQNFLFPRKLAVQVTAENESFYTAKIKKVEQRKEVIASSTSMLAERIKSISITIKRKIHDDGKLYAAISPQEIVDALALIPDKVSIRKSQVEFDKSIKAKGTYENMVTITLSSTLKPKLKQLKVVPAPE